MNVFSHSSQCMALGEMCDFMCRVKLALVVNVELQSLHLYFFPRSMVLCRKGEGGGLLKQHNHKLCLTNNYPGHQLENRYRSGADIPATTTYKYIAIVELIDRPTFTPESFNVVTL